MSREEGVIGRWGWTRRTSSPEVKWEACKKEAFKSMEKFPVDKGIKPLVDALMELPYVITIASCEGHPERPFSEYIFPYVNFLVKEEYAPKIIPRLLELAKKEGFVVEDWTEEFSKEDFDLAEFPWGSHYVNLRMSYEDRERLVPLLVEKIRELKSEVLDN